MTPTKADFAAFLQEPYPSLSKEERVAMDTVYKEMKSYFWALSEFFFQDGLGCGWDKSLQDARTRAAKMILQESSQKITRAVGAKVIHSHTARMGQLMSQYEAVPNTMLLHTLRLALRIEEDEDVRRFYKLSWALDHYRNPNWQLSMIRKKTKKQTKDHSLSQADRRWLKADRREIRNLLLSNRKTHLASRREQVREILFEPPFLAVLQYACSVTDPPHQLQAGTTLPLAPLSCILAEALSITHDRDIKIMAQSVRVLLRCDSA